MIQSVLLFKLLLLCLVVQKAFADDPLVSKEIPASIKCHRNRGANKGLRDMEKKAASTKYYEACYDYTINQDDECELMNQRVVDLYNFAYGDDTIYEVETPIISPSNVYPNDKICFFEIGKRKKNFVYQYFFPDLYQQDLEGSLTIVDSGNTAVVTEGTCKDFFEFREKQFDDETYPNELVTCGNIADPRIQFGVDVASALTLVFKSDQMKGLQGLSLSVLEHKPPPDDDDDGKRKKRNIEVPRGLKGARGDTGKQGVPGEPGSNGIPGKDGLKGIKGQRGIPGVTGPKGDQGLPGKVGIPGDIGTTGRIGIPCSCLSFTNCEPGTPGRKGAKGLKGSLGDVGPRGDSGRPGIPGLRGMPGEIGRKGDKGINGTKGLPGPRGDQGFPGLRGKPGPPGPPGLGGCPLPSEKELPRHIREVEHILSTIAELYNNLGVEKQMPGDEFYDYIMKKPIHEKDGLSDHLYRDERRVTRSTKSSTDCNGILVIPGPKGCPGIPGLPGGNGRKGLPGVPGIDGTSGKAGVPGPPGLQGAKGTDGINGPKGLKGEKGDTGLPGDPGYCRCFQNKEEIKASRNTFLQRSGGNGTLRKQGPRGPRGQKGTQGSVGENGSPGSPGWRGPKGFKGNKGVSGRTGSNGKPGSKGRLGPPGIPGLTGPPGPPGPPGCVCNNLIILLDKYGFVRHTKSPDLRVDGNGTKQENISTVFYFKPNVTCIRNDSGPAIIGLKGVQGLPGYPGANGDPGISGLPGMDGVPGMHGSYGDQGLIGRTGIKGSRGKQGQKGKAGINGKQGSPGSNATCILGIRRNLIAVKCPRGCSDGLDGAIGDKGDAGPKGLQSLKGFKGTRGLPGPRGVAGKTGLRGEEGSVGLPGVKGPPGLTGLPGAVGPAGPAGPPGSSDTCPEYDGVDFDKLLSPSKEDIKLIKLLINTSNPELAARLTNREFPLLRELAKLITGGYKFRTARCPELDRPTNGTVLFRRYNNRNNQIVATFYCNEGFSLKGPKFLSCIHGHGKWSSSPPVCVRQ